MLSRDGGPPTNLRLNSSGFGFGRGLALTEAAMKVVRAIKGIEEIILVIQIDDFYLNLIPDLRL